VTKPVTSGDKAVTFSGEKLHHTKNGDKILVTGGYRHLPMRRFLVELERLLQGAIKGRDEVEDLNDDGNHEWTSY
jgi:hypothetical protein